MKIKNNPVFSLLLALIAMMSWASAGAQPKTESRSFRGVEYDIYILPKGRKNLKRLSMCVLDSLTPWEKVVRDQTNALKGKPFFAVNGGIYEGSNPCRPKGLFVVDGTEIQPLDQGEGKGNFYMKPNGVFLTTSKGKFYVVSTTDYNQYQSKVNFATQSGPLLVHNDQLNPHFKKGSANAFLRLGVGVIEDNKEAAMVFAIPHQPVNFFDFASFFKEEMHCQNALCLESKGVNMHLPYVPRKDIKAPVITAIIIEE